MPRQASPSPDRDLRASYAERLALASVFRGIGGAAISAIARAAEMRALRRKQVLWKQGSHALCRVGPGPTTSSKTRPHGVMALAILTALLMVLGLRLPLSMVVLALPVALALAFVAARAMGETDVVPTKALTPLAQLLFVSSGFCGRP